MTEKRRSGANSIHLDAVGGVAGDMFAAALLDARPDLWSEVTRALKALELPAEVSVDLIEVAGGFKGRRLEVRDGSAPSHHHHHHHHAYHHSHTRWADIRARLEAAPLDGEARRHAIGIFTVLAEAEAWVHGQPPDEVGFHEVGAIDSIVDVVAAAALIAAVDAEIWTIGPVPRGSGLVRTAHGVLPLPAPAAARLLTGLILSEDEEEGERTTPTGAAILAWLRPSQEPARAARRLLAQGNGFGARRLKHRPNILRALIFAHQEGGAAEWWADEAPGLERDEVAVLRFEVDDQTGEDLGLALERIRAADGVIDACQWPVFGKKGRMGAAVQILAEPRAMNVAVALALTETTTLGVRRETVARGTLARHAAQAGGLPVKLARRPCGRASAKVEMEALAAIPGAAERAARRAEAEGAALAAHGEARDAVWTAHGETKGAVWTAHGETKGAVWTAPNQELPA